MMLLGAPALAQPIPPSPQASAQRPDPPPEDQRAAPGHAGWVVDELSGCWVWAVNPVPDLAVTWGGQCPEGPAQGPGRGEWRFTLQGQPVVERFEVPFRNGRAHGRGIHEYADGDRFEGDFQRGLKHGEGVLETAEGDRYEGDFREGLAHGHGIFTWSNGSRYEGGFREGLFHGEGLFVWAGGSRYEGGFRDGFAHGEGEYFHSSEGWFRGQWERGCFRGTDGAVAWIGREPEDCQ